jgi:cytochrome c peroxidase
MTWSRIPGYLCATALALVAAAPALRSQIIGSFPHPPAPLGNPTYAMTGNLSDYEEEMLGKALFFDEQLSSDDTMACATCHASAAGGNDINGGKLHPGLDGMFFTPDDEFGSPAMIRQDYWGNYIHDPIYGVDRQATGLNAPTQINAAFFNQLFWDMRAGPAFLDQSAVPIPGFFSDAALEDQAVGPPTSPVEMAHDNIRWTQITPKLELQLVLNLATGITPDLVPYIGMDYDKFFAIVYGGPYPHVTRERIGMALAAYMRTLVSDQAPIDSGIFSLTMSQQAGFFIFSDRTRAACYRCHSTGHLAIDAMGFFIDPNDNLFSDGQSHSINLPGHPRRVKTPTLRNVGLHRRFFSSGQAVSVLDTFNQQYNNPATPPGFAFSPLLNPVELSQVVDFIENALVDPRVAAATPPFDEPVLRGITKPFGSNILGAGTAGTGGFVPTIIGNSPEKFGNPIFKIGLGTALPGATATLNVSSGVILNQNFGGVIIHLDTSTMTTVGTFTVVGAAPGEGCATAFIGIPNNPGLAGTFMAYQWLVADPMAPGGMAVTPAATFTIF